MKQLRLFSLLIVLVAVIWFIAKPASITCDPNIGSTTMSTTKYSAVVVGATGLVWHIMIPGGIGKPLIRELVESPLCTKVTALVIII